MILHIFLICHGITQEGNKVGGKFFFSEVPLHVSCIWIKNNNNLDKGIKSYSIWNRDSLFVQSLTPPHGQLFLHEEYLVIKAIDYVNFRLILIVIICCKK